MVLQCQLCVLRGLILFCVDWCGSRKKKKIEVEDYVLKRKLIHLFKDAHDLQTPFRSIDAVL